MEAKAARTQADTLLKAIASEAGLELGQVLLGRYEIRRVLGRGAFGQVVEVRDRTTGIDYALKRLPPELAGNQAQMAGILANFTLVSRLGHDHIATTRFVEVDPSSGQIYVLMDLVRGMNLRQWLAAQNANNEPLAIETVLGIAEQIASALDYAHSQAVSQGSDGRPKRYGIVHRDLKPENIMIESGVGFRHGVPGVKLVDFGLAAEIQKSIQSMSEVGTGKLAGTPYYMSPEQWEGRTLTRGVDQWALAVIVYELAEGRKPFDGPSETAVMTNIKAANPEQPISLSDCQWKALKVAFSIDRKLRYRSCMEFIKALAKAEKRTAKCVKSAVRDLPDEFEGVTRSSKSKVAESFGRWGKWAAAVLAVVVLGAGGWYWYDQDRQKVDARHKADLAEQARAVQTRQETESAKRKRVADESEKQRQAMAQAEVVKAAEERLKKDEAGRLAQEQSHKRNENRNALSTAIVASIDAKKSGNWKQVLALLETLRALPDNLDHPNSKAADSLIAESKAELQKRADFDSKVTEAKNHFKNSLLNEALSACGEARTIWPEYPKPGEIDGIEQQAQDVLRKAQAEKVAIKKEQKYKSAMTEVWRLLPLYEKLEAKSSELESAVRPALEAKPNDLEANAILQILKTPKELSLDLGNGVKMEFVFVPAGNFVMGHKNANEDSDEVNYHPPHNVEITQPFFIAKYPVTVEQFRRFTIASAYRTDAEKGDSDVPKGGRILGDEWHWDPNANWQSPGFTPQESNAPVVLVDWNDTQQFTIWLSQLTDNVLRLPTEAEWEYAARGPNGNIWPWGNTVNPKLFNYFPDSEKHFNQIDAGKIDGHVFTSPVGTYKNSSWCGAVDMIGNVRQMCNDWYSKAYYDYSATIDPQGPAQGDVKSALGKAFPVRVLRGGSWFDCPG